MMFSRYRGKSGNPWGKSILSSMSGEATLCIERQLVGMSVDRECHNAGIDHFPACDIIIAVVIVLLRML